MQHNVALAFGACGSSTENDWHQVIWLHTLEHMHTEIGSRYVLTSKAEL